MGEVSDDLQQLMRVMAERMAHKWKKRGARNMNEERAVAMMRIRRLIGIEAVRSLARMKLERASWVCLSEEQKASVMNAQRHQEILLAIAIVTKRNWPHATRCVRGQGRNHYFKNNLLDLDDGGC